MTRPVERVIAALTGQEHLTAAEIHRVVDRALQPDEPTTPGAIVLLFDRFVPLLSAGAVMSEPGAVLQYVPGNPMDDEASGFARWYDAEAGAYRTWDWICERDGQMRVFVPAGVTS